MRALAGDVLRRADVDVIEAGDAEAVVAQWRAHQPDVIVLDHLMPPDTGLHIAERILAEQPQQVIFLFTALNDADIRAKCAAVGIRRCVPKQDVFELPDLVRDALSPG